MKVSVVIRTRDRENYFDSLIQNLAQQTAQTSEIIVVDNYSTEEKLEILSKNLRENVKKHFKAKVRLKLVPVTDNEFSHAYSTNLGVNAAENGLVCITNAHSLPISLRWLQDGVRHFKDSKVAGVSGFFVPHREESTFGNLNEAVYYLSQKTIAHQNRFCTINSIVRRSLWEIYPFDENLPKIIPETKRYGLEDYDWSEEMMARGFKIAIDPSFSVFHSHERGLSDVTRNLKRYFVYRRIQRKIDAFTRPRKSFSRALLEKDATKTIEITI